MSNEAAERLRRSVDPTMMRWAPSDPVDRLAFLRQLDTERRISATVERKATVERIEAASIRSTRVGLPGPAEVWIVPVAILDAEAAR